MRLTEDLWKELRAIWAEVGGEFKYFVMAALWHAIDDYRAERWKPKPHKGRRGPLPDSTRDDDG